MQSYPSPAGTPNKGAKIFKIPVPAASGRGIQ